MGSKINWFQTQLCWISNYLRFQIPVVWDSSHVVLNWFQLFWKSVALKVNGFETQVTWNSSDLQFNCFEIQMLWNSNDLRFNCFEIQIFRDSTALGFKWFEIQMLWDSSDLRFKGFGCQLVWDSNDLAVSWFEIPLISNSIGLNCSWFETQFVWDSHEMGSKRWDSNDFRFSCFENRFESHSIWDAICKSSYSRFTWCESQLLWDSMGAKIKNEACANSKTKLFCETFTKTKLWSSKTKLLCETSSKNAALKFKNVAFLQDFLQKWNFEAQKRTVSGRLRLWSKKKNNFFCETSFKNDMRAWRLASELQYVLTILKRMLQSTAPPTQELSRGIRTPVTATRNDRCKVTCPWQEIANLPQIQRPRPQTSTLQSPKSLRLPREKHHFGPSSRLPTFLQPCHAKSTLDLQKKWSGTLVF